MPRGVYRRATLAERFWSRVQKTVGCWLWTGLVDKDGYGVLFSRTGTHGPLRRVRVHRLSFELHVGPVVDGRFVLHDCPGGDNPRCVRPDHLWLGTPADNMRDMAAKGRGYIGGPDRPRRGEQVSWSKLTEEQVRTLRAQYAAGGVTQARLAEQYAIDQTTVSAIVLRKKWQHVD